MIERIRILVVDDVAETRKNLGVLLQLEEDIEVIGEASNGEEALERAKQLKPDLVLMDINMPVMDGIQATEKMTVEMPQIAIIILSVQGEGEYLRKAMASGAREYLIKPYSRDELVATIHRVYEFERKRRMSQSLSPDIATGKPTRPGKIISVFSTKGGVGKSTIAANLAVAIAQLSGKKTVLTDLNLQFGDIAMMFDLLPNRTIADLIAEPEHLDVKVLDGYLINHASGIKILPAPLRPEFAESVHGGDIEKVLKVLKENYDFTVNDMHQAIDDITLAALDASDIILLVTTLDVLTIKNVKLAIEVMNSLNYEPSKIKLILNQAIAEPNAGGRFKISPTDLENSLNFPITHSIPNESRIALGACNRGIPFVINDPKAPISMAIMDLARELLGLKEDRKIKPNLLLRRK